MDIECQGCYYTLCSFICLTEDLSEILQFLWKHGCLRRSYSCEKCGRKCAIGDKDLFFRCNRNTLDPPITPQQAQNLSTYSDSEVVQQTPSHIKTNGSDQILPKIEHIHQDQYIIIPSCSTDTAQQGTSISVPATAPENLLFANHEERLFHHDLLSDKKVQSDSVNLTYVPNSIVNVNNLTKSESILTVSNSQESQVAERKNLSSRLIDCENSNLLLIPVLQSESQNTNQSGAGVNESTKRGEGEPPNKALKSCKHEVAKKKRCNFKVSMKKGTFFEKSKLPIDTVCKFVVFWCCMKHPTQEFLRNELSLATRTVVDWSTSCREICIHWAKSVSEKIGGDGVMVQVDEVKIQDNKDSKQNDKGNRFSFWGMEKDKENGKIFIVPVPVCDTWSLLSVVNDWILPGSVIISNCWKSYDCLKLKEFVQQTIVQSKTFVHPQSNVGQQNFDVKAEEAGVSSGGELHMPRFGTRRSHHLGDLAEFMFKRSKFGRVAHVIRRQYSSHSRGLQVCIVGGGPAGFYGAQQLTKLMPTATVDILERLPVPFGLVRYGVAPDHADVKNVISTFTKTAKNPQVNFYGNLCLGRDFTLKDLQDSYHVVLLTYGAEEDRKLNISGEELDNVISARRFVGWYNGLPMDKNLKVDLNIENVVLIGQGNVAVDVARILLSSIEKLKKTDITEHALEQLATSKVKNVFFVGRRGPLQIACTIKEIREMINLPGVKTIFDKCDFEGLDKIIPSLGRPRKRLTELLYKSAMETRTSEGDKSFNVIFKRSPLEFLGQEKVKSVNFAVNTLDGEDVESQRAVSTDLIKQLPCDLALRSIGYKSTQVEPSIPFNTMNGTIVNENGRIAPGLYCSGWVSTGPVGVIVSTMTNAFTTAHVIYNDWKEKSLIGEPTRPGSEHILNIARNKGIQIVRFTDWEKIDSEEVRRGKTKGKPREKIISVREMLSVAG